MTRYKRGKYHGKTRYCQIVWEPVGGEVERWCTFHSMWYLDCLVCGDWFHTHRPHTKYCSDACNQKAYRARLNEALKQK